MTWAAERPPSSSEGGKCNSQNLRSPDAGVGYRRIAGKPIGNMQNFYNRSSRQVKMRTPNCRIIATV